MKHSKQKYAKRACIILILGLMTAHCKTIKPYEKEYLMGPLMDDAEIAKLEPKLGKTVCGNFEKLASGGPSSGSSSCPTCGI